MEVKENEEGGSEEKGEGEVKDGGEAKAEVEGEGRAYKETESKAVETGEAVIDTKGKLLSAGELVEVKYLNIEPKQGRAELDDTRNSACEEEESRSGFDSNSFVQNKFKKRGIRLNESRSCFCCGSAQQKKDKCFT